MERDRLLDLLRPLTDGDWRRPTACPGWDVLGLAVHLLGADLGLVSQRRDQFMGTPSPQNLSESEFIDWLDALQAQWVLAARRISPRLVVEVLEWSGPRLVEVFEAEGLSAMGARVSWAGPEPAPVWLDQLRELSEYWIHRQQLLEALDRPPDLDPLLLRPVLLGLRGAYPHRLTEARVPTTGQVLIEIGEPIDEDWILVPNHGTWEFTEGSNRNVIARGSFTADQAWRLLTNNLDRDVDLDLRGDDRIVGVISRTRAIIGHPN